MKLETIDVICIFYMYQYSAGIGRTGTFIAIDSLIQEADKDAIVDVLKRVCGMRVERMGMIQTLVIINNILLTFVLYICLLLTLLMCISTLGSI